MRSSPHSPQNETAQPWPGPDRGLARAEAAASSVAWFYTATLAWFCSAVDRSAGDARNQYVRLMSASNPASPLKAYSPTTVVQPVIKSISLLSRDTALVRFESERRESGSVVGDRAAFAAVIKFRYTGAPMRMGDRFLNPLGFQVTSYRRDSEMIGSSAASQGVR